MIISHLHKFIYIKTRKTAGTSIEMVLAEKCGPDDVITGINPASLPAGYIHPARNAEGPLAYGHASPETIRTHVPPDVWSSYLKIAPIRNPWDRVVSMYWFRKKESNQKQHDFETFVRLFGTGGSLGADGLNIPSHCGFLKTSDTHSIAADCFVRYEHLHQDVARLSDRINVPLSPLPHAKADYRQDSKPFQDYYDSMTRDFIAANYADDIERFGYTFDLVDR